MEIYSESVVRLIGVAFVVSMCFVDENVEGAFLPARPEALKPYKLGEGLDLAMICNPGKSQFSGKEQKKLDM